MIDMHCHILPNLDDGSQSLDESIEMAYAAVKNGIHTIIATPHHANGQYLNEAMQIQAAVARLQQELEQRQIPLHIFPGQEIRVYGKLVEDFHNNLLQPLHQSKYILLEFPSSNIPQTIQDVIHELRVLNMVPIIAHPERNREILLHPERLLDLIECGALSQVTSHSLNGKFGTKIQKASIHLCKHNLVHFVASDAHNLMYRGFDLRLAYEYIDATLGSKYAAYYQSNAKSLVENRQVEKWTPIKRQKRWFSFW